MNINTRCLLYNHIFNAIESAVNNMTQYQEPDYIASLTTKLPPLLSQIFNQHIPQISYRVRGCFVHQKPLVQFVDAKYSGFKKPEIGDLLIVYEEIKNTSKRYNAILLQAKKTKDIYNTALNPNDHQLLLYTQWPKFKYVKAGHLNGHIRSINPKTINSGAQYLLIDQFHGTAHFPFHSTFWCSIADQNLCASNTLAMVLLQFIEFQTGRTFVSKRQNMDHWSRNDMGPSGYYIKSCF